MKSSVLLLPCVILAVSCGLVDIRHPVLLKGPDAGAAFGFRVALHYIDGQPWALVTAPRGNSTVHRSLVSPGVLFKCSILSALRNRGICQEVVLESDVMNVRFLDPIDHEEYKEVRDEMWLGISLAVESNKRKGRVAVCSHLWKNSYFDNEYYANGLCYMLKNDLKKSSGIDKIIPFKRKDIFIVNGHNYYAYAQAGFSSAFSNRGGSLHIGAPGLYDWSGGTGGFSYELKKSFLPASRPSKKENCYTGYSMVMLSVKPRGQVIATGSPRNADEKGKVYVMHSSSSRSQVREELNGEQMGEYFGAALEGVDLNNDGIIDLLVGSPFFSIGAGDEGKVTLFFEINNIMQKGIELYGSRSPHARFGTSISNLHDVNSDGFNDVAVGAPYEEGTGAVYIYLGRPTTGLNPQFHQRIRPSDIGLSIQTFGYSLSNGGDVDSNNCPDLLVGAYKSDVVVLLRSRPAADIDVELNFSPQQINGNLSSCLVEGKRLDCVNITYCLQMVSMAHTLPASVEVTLDLDTGLHQDPLPRTFLLLGSSRQPFYQQRTNLTIGGSTPRSCSTQRVLIRHNVFDVISPVQVRLSYALHDPVTPDFCPNCPVLESPSSNSITRLISFQTGCGTICRSHLILTGSITDISAPSCGGLARCPGIVVGQPAALTLLLKVMNTGEPSYQTELGIWLPPQLILFNSGGRLCSSDVTQAHHPTNASLYCSAGNPLRQDEPANFTIKLSADLQDFSDALELYAEVNTVSQNTNPKSKLELKIPVFISAGATIKGLSKPEKAVLEPTANVTITVQVRKYLPSPINEAHITLKLPVGPLDQPFTRINDFKIKGGSIFRGDCNITDSVERSKREAIAEELSATEDLIVLNCTTVRCLVIQCWAGPLLDRQPLVLTVEAVLGNFTQAGAREFALISEASVEIPKSGRDLPSSYQLPFHTQIVTRVLKPLPPATGPSKTLLIGGVAVGLLILFALIFILVKAGFFRRKKQEELRRLVEQAQTTRDDAFNTAGEQANTEFDIVTKSNK